MPYLTRRELDNLEFDSYAMRNEILKALLEFMVSKKFIKKENNNYVISDKPFRCITFEMCNMDCDNEVIMNLLDKAK